MLSFIFYFDRMIQFVHDPLGKLGMQSGIENVFPIVTAHHPLCSVKQEMLKKYADCGQNHQDSHDWCLFCGV